MNKSNINMENVLPELPDGFDKGKIVMPKQVRRGQANTLRLYKCDFDPIERSLFKGFFAVPNKKHIGTKESVAERARTLIANGGATRVSGRCSCASSRRSHTSKGSTSSSTSNRLNERRQVK